MPRIIVLPDVDQTHIPGALFDEHVSVDHLNEEEAAVPFLTRLNDAIEGADATHRLIERITQSTVAGYARAAW